MAHTAFGSPQRCKRCGGVYFKTQPRQNYCTYECRMVAKYAARRAKRAREGSK